MFLMKYQIIGLLASITLLFISSGIYTFEKTTINHKQLLIKCGHWFKALKHTTSHNPIFFPLSAIEHRYASYKLQATKEDALWIFQIKDSQDELIGEAWYTLCKNNTCFFNLIWIKPEHRRSRLGTFLINFSLAHLSSIGCKKIIGRAENVKNTENMSIDQKIQWYQRLGAQHTPRWLDRSRMTYNITPMNSTYEQLHSKL